MARTRKGKDERMFTIELRSKDGAKSLSLDGDGKLLMEGSLGSFERARFVDGLVLEVIGSDGELRVDLAMNELRLRPQGDERGGE